MLPRPRPLVRLIGQLVASGALTVHSLQALGAGGAPVRAPLPVLRPNSSPGNVDPASLTRVIRGYTWCQPTCTTYNQALVIQQTGSSASIQWDGFDVGAGNLVRFVQPSSNSVVYNQIGSGVPSQILGRLSANGQVYLINPNGVLFGNGSQVDVGALVASSLQPNDALYAKGLFFGASLQNPVAAFQAPADLSASIVVEPQAQISSASQGRVLLIAPTVDNAGQISSPAGQVAMVAAKSPVYLFPATSDVRGMYVGIAGDAGVVRNQPGASVSSARGNVTLAGLTVNQEGLATATTTVNLNGSITLVAGSHAQPGPSSVSVVSGLAPTVGGLVQFGSQSRTAVRPDLTDTATAYDSQIQPVSTISAVGQTVQVAGGASLVAPSGQIALSARANPSTPANPNGGGAAGVLLVDAGATLDVSGSQAVPVSMMENFLTINLRANEFADQPLQRNGFLYGKSITVDLRTLGTSGNIPVADIAGATTTLQRGIGERTVKGGNIQLVAEGSAVLAPGATLNVSGGSIAYQGAEVQSTTLIGADGRLYPVAVAPADLQYTGFAGAYTSNNNRWGLLTNWGNAPGGSATYQAGYLQGAAAGTVQIVSPSAHLGANFLGDTVIGPYQRNLASSRLTAYDLLPTPGTFQIGDPGAVAGGVGLDYRTGPITLVSAVKPLNPAFTDSALLMTGLTGAAADNLEVPVSSLVQSGFGRFRVYSDQTLSLPAGLDLQLPAGGGITLVGANLDIQGSIHVPSGNVQLQTTPNNVLPGAGLALTLGAGATLDVSGRWTNDRPALNPVTPHDAIALNGGTISLVSQGNLTLTSGSVLSANAGGWLNASGAFSAGNGGSITLQSGVNPTDANLRSPFSVQLGATVSAFGLGSGGTFALTSNRVTLGDLADPARQVLGNELLSNDGFAKISLTGRDELAVADSTQAITQLKSWSLASNYAGFRSNTAMSTLVKAGLLPAPLRSGVALSLASTDYSPNDPSVGNLRIGTGVSLLADPGSSIKLNASHLIDVEGQVTAPGGTIALNLGTTSDAYVGSRVIWLGSQGSLSAPAVALVTNNAQGQPTGRILDGGTVSLNANSGYIVTAPGSHIDVHGVDAMLQSPQLVAGHSVLQPTNLFGTAGTLNLSAAEGMFLGGNYNAQGANSAGAAGGTLNVAVAQAPVTGPSLARSISLGNALPALLAGFKPGDTFADSADGKATVPVSAVQSAGFDAVSISARDGISFQGGTGLSVGRSLNLDAPVFQAVQGSTSLSLAAPYVGFGNTNNPSGGLRSTTSGGPATLSISGGFVDLFGNFSTQGLATLNVHSDSDVRLNGSVTGATATQATGVLNTAGALNIDAAQVYPSTASAFTLNSATAVTLSNTAGTASQTPMSAGGAVNVNAPSINQTGVLRAPLGQISLNASDSLSLTGPGSLTSVSLNGLTVPYGTTLNNALWSYSGSTFSNGFGNVLGSFYSGVLNAPPAKLVNLQGGRSVTVSGGASIDASGSGDLLTSEFFKGPGGSNPLLTQPSAFGTTLYALLPSLSGPNTFAPFDPALQSPYVGTSALRPGTGVNLTNVPGLRDGIYALLPAGYAVLPGAFAIRVANGSQFAALAPGQVDHLNDGSVVVAGQFTVAGTTDHSSGYTAFQVIPSAVIRKQAEYDLNFANSYFPALARANATVTPALPLDAGQLALNSQSSLTLTGASIANLQASGSGRGGQVDINAANIAVVSAVDPTNTALAGYVQLSADVLDSLKAESLLLGATRNSAVDANGNLTGAQVLTVGASQVQVLNDSNHPLNGPEITLAAKNSVLVQSGSVIVADSAPTLTPSTYNIVGNGALVRVSGGSQTSVSRSGLVSSSTGSVQVQAGARLAGSGAVLLDATRDTQLGSGVALATPDLSAAASFISLGAVPAGLGGLILDTNTLQSLSGARSLVLKGYGGIGLYGALTFGGSGLNTLTLDTPGIEGFGGGTRTLTASTINLQDTSSVSPVSAGSGGGTLMVHANNGMNIQGGNVELRGFDQVTLAAEQAVQVKANATLNAVGDLNLVTPVIQAGSASVSTLASSGSLGLSAPASTGAQVGSTASTLGATLTLTGGTVQVATSIDLPAGTINLHALTGDVTLAAGGSLQAPGRVQTFNDATVAAPAGSVNLLADQGNVYLRTGAVVAVNGVGGADAGSLTVVAQNGSFQLDGTVQGGAASGPSNKAPGQGQFILDVKGLDTGALPPGQALTSIDQALNAGGFNGRRNIHVGQGDLQIVSQPDAALRAKEVTLSTDRGNIDVFGVVDASGVDGGQVNLWASGNLTVHAGASVLAGASSSTGQAGAINLGVGTGTAYGTLDIEGAQGVLPAAVLDTSVQGSSSGTGGRILLRAAQTGSGSSADVAIREIAGQVVSGSGDVTVEAVRTYSNVGSITSVLENQVATNAAGFFTNSNLLRIRNRLAGSGAAAKPLQIQAGVEIDSAAGQDLNLTSQWNLAGLRPGGQPGILTLRAGGNLNVLANLSDGFTNLAADAPLISGPSWSYRLSGGADLAAANPLAVRSASALPPLASPTASGAGSVIFGVNTTTRTGTGNISVSAGRDVILSESPSSPSAVVYTAGSAAPDLAGFNVPSFVSLGNGAQVTAQYGTGGGNLNIVAGADILGTNIGSTVGTLTASPQLFSDWLYRVGQVDPVTGFFYTPDTNVQGTPAYTQTSWWVNYASFRQDIGALGGGNVSVRAGGNINDLSVSIPTSGRVANGVGNSASDLPSLASLVVTGGGNLDVSAGGNVQNGTFLVGAGHGSVQAGGSIATPAIAGRPARQTILALGDADIKVTAAGGVSLEAVYNPTLVAQVTGNFQDSGDGMDSSSGSFSTYGTRSAVNVTAVGGNITYNGLQGNPGSTLARYEPARNSVFGSSDAAYLLAPPTVDFAALSGSINLTGTLALAPAASGNLQLLARQNVTVGSNSTVVMSSENPSALPGVAAPSALNAGYVTNTSVTPTTAVSYAVNPQQQQTPLHAGDSQPALIQALEGDISGGGLIAIPKPALIRAGRDFIDMRYLGQNLAASDTTSITAGRDILYDAAAQTSEAATLSVGGPGNFSLEAGRNINLGRFGGVLSTGNQNDLSLPQNQGAAIVLTAGLGSIGTGPVSPDYQGFAKRYLDPSSKDALPYGQALVDYLALVSSGQPFVTSSSTLVPGTAPAASNADIAQAWKSFQALPDQQQQVLARQVLFNELVVTGRLHNTQGTDFARGYAAIATLFPGASYQGSLEMFNSQVKTLQGGAIQILVPGGRVNAGLANAQPGVTKTPLNLGIVTVNGGAVEAVTGSDFLVNSSRVFSLAGGDIAMWSSTGNIDAGKGAKTAVLVPPPLVTIDPNTGKLTVTIQGAATGSGIGALITAADQAASNVDLIAPTGTVNAGDAGIRASGTVNIAAVRVIGADNISAAKVTGVPAALDTGNLAGALGNVGAAGQDASKAADAVGRQANDAAEAGNAAATAFRPSFITVEVETVDSDGEDNNGRRRERK